MKTQREKIHIISNKKSTNLKGIYICLFVGREAETGHGWEAGAGAPGRNTGP